MNFDIVIIGGGASGLCTAIKAKKASNSILVIDHNNSIGKKILSTGNGKCNLTNSFCRTDLFNSNPEGIYPYFSSGNRYFIEDVISAFDFQQTISFFNSLGVFTENKNGYIYPRSEQAAAILNALKSQCSFKGINITCSQEVSDIKILKNSEYRFCINKNIYCKKLVLACGGKSASKTGSDGSGYSLAEMLGHTIIKPLPALCAIKCSDNFFKAISGVRNDSAVSMFDSDNNLILRSYGNVQFTSYGISGIPVFQISGTAARMLDEGKKFSIYLDLLPDIEINDLENFIDSTAVKYRDLSGLLNSKLAGVIVNEISDLKNVSDKSFARAAVDIIKNFKVTPVSAVSFEESQVTQGGVCTDEIYSDTMESKLVPGLYFTGEIIDVNGICGGYNLQWAWSTAHIAANNL